MVCHRKAMGLGGKSIAFSSHFSPFFGGKTAIFGAKISAQNPNVLSVRELQNLARFQNLKASRQLVENIARKQRLQKSKCKPNP